ncbi:polyamine aminopropyltransferase [bacterium]|nr:polyamine aminopropyltransferase [bacterium]
MENKNTLSSKEAVILLLSVFIVGFCTIIYELLIGSVSSYFLGDSIRQFSIVIGLTMTAMGLGTLISRLINKNLIYYFILVEVILAVIGGLCVPILYFAYTVEAVYYPVMILLILLIGGLIGLEIPLLTRIMEKYYNLKDNISNVLSLDYLGAFIATVVFPFILLPFLGVFESSIFAGFLNLIVAIINFIWFKDKILKKRVVKIVSLMVLIFVFLAGLFLFSKEVVKFWENNIFEDRVIFSKQTPYQKVVMTKNKEDIRLFIDGNVQFSSVDEYRYHELLVHIPMNLVKHRENILILGGGDGLATREILKYDDVKSITVVDLDKEITDLAKNERILRELNNDSFNNPKVNIINDDAFKFLENANNFYDLIIIDLPDPNNSSLARLYSREFYRLVKKKLAYQGLMVTQSTSPFFSPEAYWCINESIKAARFNYTYPYHVYVPAFGDWGFILGSNIKFDINDININIETKFIDKDVIKNAFKLEKDVQRENIEPSTLDRPKVLEYYLNGWRYWN